MQNTENFLRRNLALFDLDNTLLPLDSDHGWGEFTVRIGWCSAQEFSQRNDAFFADYLAGRLDIHDYVRFATQAIVQRGQKEAQEAHRRFMHEVIRPAIHPRALELVRSHQEAGDLVVITSATNEFVTRPIAQAFGVEHLIATELERDPLSGWFTGEIRGQPNMRSGKVVRLEQWLCAQNLDWTQIQASFYSDSMNDLPLLEKVQRPIATNPDEQLRTLALERGWQVLDLFLND